MSELKKPYSYETTTTNGRYDLFKNNKGVGYIYNDSPDSLVRALNIGINAEKVLKEAAELLELTQEVGDFELDIKGDDGEVLKTYSAKGICKKVNQLLHDRP